MTERVSCALLMVCWRRWRMMLSGNPFSRSWRVDRPPSAADYFDVPPIENHRLSNAKPRAANTVFRKRAL